MKLTKRNYFTIRNKYITNSKITDWLKDKNYFYRKHVLGEIPQKVTDSMVIGKAVDTWLTEGEKKFRDNFIAVTRRNLSNPPDDYTELPMNQYAMVEKICRRVEQIQAFKELKGFKKQKILQYDMDLGIFEGIAGIPDWYKIVDNELGIIVDLKTAPSIIPIRYYRHCYDYGYFRQQAMYQMLLEYTANIKKFESYHIVVEKDPDEIFDVAIFKLNQNIIEDKKKEINQILADIKKERRFLPKNISFADAIDLGNSYETIQAPEGFVE